MPPLNPYTRHIGNTPKHPTPIRMTLVVDASYGSKGIALLITFFLFGLLLRMLWPMRLVMCCYIRLRKSDMTPEMGMESHSVTCSVSYY